MILDEFTGRNCKRTEYIDAPPAQRKNAHTSSTMDLSHGYRGLKQINSIKPSIHKEKQMKRQDFERFLNERAHGVTCAVCGRQDWMMNVNEENENILIMCSHCGHVVSFNRSYVKSLLGETDVEDPDSDSSDNEGGNADNDFEHGHAALPVA